VTGMSDPLALRLATWLAALDWPALPARQRDLAQLRLLDSVGLMLGARDAPVAAALLPRIAAESGRGGSSAVGVAAAVSAPWAALANGVLAHCLDYDDTFPDSVVHPGSAIVPTALAVGEETGASGGEILTAIAGGYEIAARLAGVGDRDFHRRGFHPSGVFAPLSAAFVAGRLMRLPPMTIASAVGLAASMAGGLLAFIAEGAWSKALHLGWGGFGGILAAQLASGGFRGPLGALDGRFNLYGAFLDGTPVDPHSADRGLGQEWRSDVSLFKLYPCAHVIQPYIDLALELRRVHGIEAGAVRRVLCRVAAWAVPIVCEPAAEKVAPQTTLQAIASLPFHIAAALVDGGVTLDTAAEANLARPELLAVARRVGYAVDPDRAGFDAALEIEVQDGRRLAAVGAAAAADEARLGQKFGALAARALPFERVDALRHMVTQFPAASDARAIGALLRQAAPA
jgi:2-methylcitrate dehydratase PrpD